MSLLLPFLAFFSGTALFSILFKKKFEEVLPVYFLFVITILYFCGLVSNLLIGVYISIIFSVLGMLLFTYSVIRKGSRKNTIQLIITPGFIAFILLLVFVYIINISRFFTVWDEFSHWGVIIKEMVRLDKFHSVPESILGVHKDYPPAIQLFQYFWIKITGSYTEPGTYRAIQIFTLCLFLPIFKNLHFKNLIKFICFFAIILVIPSALGINLYNSIYTDVTIGVLFGYSLFCVVKMEKFSAFLGINLFLSIFVLTITKQIGVFFVGMILLFVFIRFLNINNLRNFKDNIKLFKKESIFSVATASIVILSTFIASKTWSSFISACKVSNIQFKISDITISGIIDIFKGNSPAFQRDTIKNFIDAFFSTNPIVPFLQLTYFQLIIIFTGIGFVVFLLFKKTSYYDKLLAFAILIPIGAFAYAGAMLLLYVFSFGSYEGPLLASYQRYMITYWTGIISSIFMLVSVFSTDFEQSTNAKKLTHKNIFWIVISILICGIITPNSIYSTIFPKNAFVRSLPYESQRETAQKLEKYIDINKDKVYLIIQGDNGLDYWLIKYYVNPIKTNAGYWSIGTKVSEGDIWTLNINLSEWSKILIDGKFDYVYVVRENESFRKEFGNLFKSLDESLNGGIYKVNVLNSNEVKLDIIKSEDER